MNIEEYRDYCLGKKGVTEEFPFDDTTIVFKVKGKMFTAAGIHLFERFNVKCDPAIALELREDFQAVIPGYHMNKKHWNTILIKSDASLNQMHQWIDHSYDLVVNSLSKKLKEELNNE